MRYSLEAGMGATLCLRCWACLTACLPSVVPMACWSSKYSAGLPPFERTSRLSTRCGFSGVRIVSSGAIHHSKCRMMQACFALVPQDNAVRSSDLRVFGLLPFAARFLGGFWVFNGSQEISISTFGHLNVCRQSRRADCGLPYACFRSSAACSFCGVLRVLDGFVLKCPKVETMYLDGVKIPGSVKFGGARSPFCGAPGPLLWRTKSVLAAHGVAVLCLRGSDDQICLRGTPSKHTRGERKKDAPKGALHANKFPRRGAPRLRRQSA